jgi:uncharacterized membrane protein affecting hemolysin expression
MLQSFFKLCSTLQKPYCLLIAISFSALFTLQLCHYIYQQQQQTLMSDTVTQYGERIAKLTADQVISSILNNDAISLQAIVQNIHTESTAHSVIIYNINNDILAQTSHATGSPQQDLSHHTAPIVSNNNIIGSATISISAASFTTPLNSTFNFILSLLLLMAIICFFLKGRNVQKLSHSDDNDNHHITTPSNDAAEEIRTSTFFLTLKLHNIETLYKQLNAELRQQQLQLLEKYIAHAMSLYGGEKHVIHHDGITLSFDKAENILNTLYSGKLILQLNEQSEHSIITLTAFIQHQETEDTLCQSLDSAKKSFCHTQKQGLFVSTTLSKNTQLNTHAQLEDCESPKIVRIRALQENYQHLLDKQLQQLQHTP